MSKDSIILNLSESEKAKYNDRLKSKVKTNEKGCIEFQGHLNNRGYGVMNVGGINFLTHRLNWIINVGDIDGDILCHKCDNPKCLNLDHLFKGTYLDNSKDMISKKGHYNKLKTHCKRNHEFSSENTRVNVFNGYTMRHCKVCESERQRIRNAKNS